MFKRKRLNVPVHIFVLSSAHFICALINCRKNFVKFYPEKVMINMRKLFYKRLINLIFRIIEILVI